LTILFFPLPPALRDPIDGGRREEKAPSEPFGSFRQSSRGERINARQIKPELLQPCGTLNRFVSSAVCSSERGAQLAEISRIEISRIEHIAKARASRRGSARPRNR